MIIEVKNLSISYKDKSLFTDISFFVKEKEIIGIKGESGVGKSTLLMSLCKIVPTIINAKMDGEIYFNSKSLKELELKEIAKNFGVVRQWVDNQLFFQTVESELVFGLENLNFSKTEMNELVNESLKILNFEGKRYYNPKDLSGGEKKLLALQSVLICKPKVLLLDEVFSHMDEENRVKFLSIIKKYANDGGTIIVIDHLLTTFSICDRIYELKNKRLEMIEI